MFRSAELILLLDVNTKRKASDAFGDDDNDIASDLLLEAHFKHPFTAIVAGPTKCGKSSWIKQLLENLRKIIPSPEKIYWCYSLWQELYETIDDDVEFVAGLLNVDKLNNKVRNLIIVDDLMDEKDDRLTKLFTKGSHHRNTSVVYITQNLFEQHKDSRTISLNAQYMIAFKNPRDPSQINHLSRQVFPSNSEYLLDSFLKATRKEHGYLFIDLSQTTPDDYRLRAHVFGQPGCPYKSEILYEPIKSKRVR